MLRLGRFRLNSGVRPLMKIRAAMFAAFMLLVSAPDADACSPRRINTPLELVALSDGIYLVTAISYSQSPTADPMRPSPLPTSHIQFRILEVLKGHRIQSLSAPGGLSKRSDFNEGLVPYTFVRSEGTGGDCFASTFHLGSQYLLIALNGSPYWSPLAPTTEQVKGPSDLWVRWVRGALLQSPSRPNNSFKPNPRRSSKHPSGLLGGSA
jgi:hypothetical protein